MKVYLVTSGTYSDYDIEAIFSTRKKAEEFVEACKDYLDDAAIVEWAVDEAVGERPTTVHTVFIDLSSGKITHPYRSTSTVIRRPSKQCNIVEMGCGQQVKVSSPVSLEHAEKVAVEQRQAWLRRDV